MSRPKGSMATPFRHPGIRAMRRVRAGLSALAALACLAFAWQGRASAADEEKAEQARRAAAMKTFREEITPFLNKYCVECHGRNNRAKQGGVSFAGAFQRPGAGELRKQWQLSMVNVKEHVMPPPDAARQPTDAERGKFIAWVPEIKHLNPRDPGLFVLRRLNKVEYGNTLRDLLGVDPSVAGKLPDEVPGEGYLNTISPLQAEQFLAIANEALDIALGPAGAPAIDALDRLFGKAPPKGSDGREAAGKVVRALARKAYRRPATDDEVGVLMRVLDLGRANGLDHHGSLRLVLKALLVSPQFLFIAPGPSAPPAGPIVPLDDHHLASRLSYFLWSTMPDAELLALADAGKLREPSALRAQVGRMLADPRSGALFDGFGVQWLRLGGLREMRFDPAKFPEMTPALRMAMIDEARMLFEEIVRGNLSVSEFIESGHTYMNESLAKLYGLEKTVTGPGMRKVRLENANRGGILGMPAILAATSFPDRTSAVKRGVWVLEQVLGEHVPPAPANVPALDNRDKKDGKGLTLRQRTEMHRANAVCANCHKIMDPIGFGLERFDAIGRWRDKDDSGAPIDSKGEMPDGKRFETPGELKAIIASRREELARNLAGKWLAYALCRQLEGYDEIVLDQLMESLARDGYRVGDLIAGIATSYPFTHRRVK